MSTKLRSQTPHDLTAAGMSPLFNWDGQPRSAKRLILGQRTKDSKGMHGEGEGWEAGGWREGEAGRIQDTVTHQAKERDTHSMD